ncbi:carboxypeptidase A4-like isoform X2 [Ptychodera flava]|uniref:carboxypeptidase A4-like isoform X2 n=1 Tax=Ptychodera flava TaxID=63121 RepID=UPI00396A7AF5
MGYQLQHLLDFSVILCTAGIVCCHRVRFDGFQVLRLTALNYQHEPFLIDLLRSEKFEFWDYPNDVMTSPENKEELVQLLLANDVLFYVLIEDIQQLIDAQYHATSFAKPAESKFDYSRYHTYYEIDRWIQDTAAEYPQLTKVFSIGHSYEQRIMRVLKVGSSWQETKPALWIQSGIHAREWISPATNIWMTNQLLKRYGNDQEITDLLDTFDFYILLITNPDGYEFTWTNNRLWRKTRSRNYNSTCYGTDANRNWPYQWGGIGASPYPCSETYRGQHPLSEIEVANVVDFITKQGKIQDFVLIMDIHSYSQMWLNPWGHTKKHPDDYETHISRQDVLLTGVTVK